MNDILNERIKAVIERYPTVGALLNEFGIACVDCAVGTCLLKNIRNSSGSRPKAGGYLNEMACAVYVYYPSTT